MRICFTLIIIISNLAANAQLMSFDERHKENQKYYTFNPISLAEPHMAIGIGFGNRFSERSEYFAELSYLNKAVPQLDKFESTIENEILIHQLLQH